MLPVNFQAVSSVQEVPLQLKRGKFLELYTTTNPTLPAGLVMQGKLLMHKHKAPLSTLTFLT